MPVVIVTALCWAVRSSHRREEEAGEHSKWERSGAGRYETSPRRQRGRSSKTAKHAA